MPTNNPTQPNKPANALFIPGPTDVLPDVLAAQTLPMIGHRSDEFEALFAKIQTQLRQLFFTDSRVYVVASSGTGMQEAAIRNAVQDRVLCFVSGAFGQRWHDVAVGCGKRVVRADVPWGTALKPAQAVDALKAALADGPVEAITLVHNETSTGVTAPVAEIRAAVRAVSPGTLIMVDAVSSFSGAHIPFDEWGLDLCLSSSQKALAVPPGLAFAAVSDRLLAKAQGVTGRGWYFDFVTLEKYLVKSTTPATPAISLMRALSVQLDHIFAEGLAERFARHHALAQRTQAWAQSRGFALGAEEGYRSPTVTQVTNSLNMDIQALNAHLGKQNMQISDGYGPFKGKAFRIGHMGECTGADLERLLAAVDEFLG